MYLNSYSYGHCVLYHILFDGQGQISENGEEIVSYRENENEANIMECKWSEGMCK
jgi:hypothetical protein